MDGAALAQLAATAVAFALGALAYVRGRRTDERKANSDDFAVVTVGLQTLVGELRAEVARLRSEVHDCELDKAQMRGEFEAEVRNLKERLRGIGGGGGA